MSRPLIYADWGDFAEGKRSGPLIYADWGDFAEE